MLMASIKLTESAHDDSDKAKVSVQEEYDFRDSELCWPHKADLVKVNPGGGFDHQDDLITSSSRVMRYS